MQIHHIGYLTKSIENYIKRCFGKVEIHTELYDDLQKSKLVLIKNQSNIFIELIEPDLNFETSLKEELNSKGEGFHHICYICNSKKEYQEYIKNSFLLAGPFYSIMFNTEIEFYTKKFNLIEEIVKKF